MPKIIKDAEGLIIKSGRKLFTGKDPRRFTTDRVARKSRMCKATLYKHFESMDSLRKSVVLEDWAAAEERIRKAMIDVSDPSGRARLLFTHLKKFANRYKNCSFNIFAAGGLLRTNVDFAGRLSDISGLFRFVVEVILTFVPLPEVTYEQIEPQIMKIL